MSSSKLPPIVDAQDFLSAAAVARLRELHAKKTDLGEKRAAADRKLRIVSANRAAIEANGGDPNEAVREARSVLDAVESQASGARSELNRELLIEQRRAETTRGELWARVHEDVVGPQAERLSQLADDFDRLVDELAETLKAESGALAELAAFDGRIPDWNALVRELGGPGNAEINPGISARKSVADALFREHKIIDRFEKATKRLKETIYPPIPPAEPLTEEQIAEAREAHETAVHEAMKR